MVKEYSVILSTQVDAAKRLQTLVQQELGPGWDWREGLEKQKRVRQEPRAAEEKRTYEFLLTICQHSLSREEWKDVIGIDVPEDGYIDGDD